jgi:PKD repeat protein
VGVSVSHAYESIGTFEVRLTVIDEMQESATCTTTAEIGYCGDCPPNCDAAGPYYGVAGSVIEFDGSGSTTWSSCVPIVIYTWSFGDGEQGSGPRPKHVYVKPGVYEVVLEVGDSDGVTFACSTTVSVSDPQTVESSTWGEIKAQGRRPE